MTFDEKEDLIHNDIYALTNIHILMNIYTLDGEPMQVAYEMAVNECYDQFYN